MFGAPYSHLLRNEVSGHIHVSDKLSAFRGISIDLDNDAHQKSNNPEKYVPV